jgi:hypothetical protein
MSALCQEASEVYTMPTEYAWMIDGSLFQLDIILVGSSILDKEKLAPAAVRRHAADAP